MDFEELTAQFIQGTRDIGNTDPTTITFKIVHPEPPLLSDPDKHPVIKGEIVRES